MYVHLCYSGFLVASTITFLCSVHFKFRVDYTVYVNATNKTALSDLAANEDNDSFKDYMHSMKWFNLQSPTDRTSALCHIMSLIKWQDRRNSLFQDIDDQDELGDMVTPRGDLQLFPNPTYPAYRYKPSS